MKTILIVLTLIFSIPAYPQSLFTTALNENPDLNGVPLRVNTALSISGYSNSDVMTAYSYDSVRALTEINIPNIADAYPWISSDGLRLYYTSGDGNNNQLMFTSRASVNDYFASPTIVSISIGNPFSFWLSQDELDAYFCTTSDLYFTHRATASSQFGTSDQIILIGAPTFSYVKGASLNSTQDVLYIDLSGFNSSYIGEFSRNSSDTFTYVRSLPTPNGYIPYAGQLSKDELSFFFPTSFNSGIDKLYQLTRATPTDSFALSSFEEIQGINDTMFSNLQPSMTEGLNWVVFVRNNTGSWQGNDLYIAHQGPLTLVPDLDKTKTTLVAFPNPSSGLIQLQLKNIKENITDGIIDVHNIIGENILHQKFANEVDISGYPKGVYFVRVKFKDEIYSDKIVLQ